MQAILAVGKSARVHAAVSDLALDQCRAAGVSESDS